MKKLLISLLVIISVFLLSIVIVNFLPKFNSSNIFSQTSHNETTAKLEVNQYLSLNGELSIVLPPEFGVSTKYGMRDMSKDVKASQSIIIATSSTTLIRIRGVIDQDQNNYSQEEAVNIFYAYKNSFNSPGPDNIIWTDILSKAHLGQNSYVFHNGTLERRNGNQVITQNIRQYITHYNNETYYIEFDSYDPNQLDAGYCDQIVSSIIFK